MTPSFPLALPYYAPADQLPAEIPSTTEILASNNIISHQRGHRFVARVGPHYVVKYGTDVALIEGENNLFVQVSCRLRVPKVYAIFTDDASGINFIVVEYIPGTTLVSEWPRLDHDSKSRIAEQLRLGLGELRQVPAQGYYGRIGKRDFFDEFFCATTAEEAALRCGPFETEAEMNEGLIQALIRSGISLQHAKYLRRCLPTIYHGHPPVLTHADLQRKNIIVTESGELVIVDWEKAGWYPDYWEYFKTIVACGLFKDDWHEWVARFLTEYTHELPWMVSIRKDMW